MKDLLIHLSRIIYKMQDVSQQDKEEILKLVKDINKKDSRFVPPTLAEVSEYLKQQGYQYPQK